MRLLIEKVDEVVTEWLDDLDLRSEVSEDARADLIGGLCGTFFGSQDAINPREDGRTWMDVYEELVK